MSITATLNLNGNQYELPVIVGTENETAVDIRKLRSDTGLITFDPGYGNTGSCQSAITYIDGEKGILRYRGYPIEQLAEHSTFLESAYLIIYGELPSEEELLRFRGRIGSNANVHPGMLRIFELFPSHSHPMAILAAMLNTLGSYHPEMTSNNREQDLAHIDWAAALLIAKVRSIVAMTYAIKAGRPWVYSRPDYRYCENLLHMMFSQPYNEYLPRSEVAQALDLILLLHADHEQNCSTSTVRMVASSGANLFASVSAGVSALWGPLHGGANMAVMRMLQEIHDSGDDGSRFIEEAKQGKRRLMGFGHRVYKNFDPRSKIIKKAAENLFSKIGSNSPLLDIALKLEETALKDSYFLERKLYPNVDFYSGIILNAIGVPLELYTVFFAIGRMPGWIANWRESALEDDQRIHRPRQVYQGSNQRDYLPIEKRQSHSDGPFSNGN